MESRREAKRRAAGGALVALRETAREAVNETTLAAVARDAGVEEPTLRRFIQGAHPGPPVRLKLVDWYMGLSAASGATSQDSARCAIAVLLAGVPPEGVGAAARELLETLARAYGAEPGWLAGLRAEMDAS